MNKRFFIALSFILAISVILILVNNLNYVKPVERSVEVIPPAIQKQSTQAQGEKQTIYGTVSKPGKVPVKSAVISWKSNDHSGTIRCQDNGYYELDLPKNIREQLALSLHKHGYRKWSSNIRINELSFPFKQDIQLTKEGLLCGQIIDKETQKHIKKSQIRISGTFEHSNAFYETQSDEDGNFCIDLTKHNILGKQCILLIQSSGYKSIICSLKLPSNQNQIFELEPGKDFIIKGNTFLNKDKSPIANVEVHFVVINSSMGLTTTSDQNGTFEIALPEADYYALGMKQGYYCNEPVKVKEPEINIPLCRSYEISGSIIEKDTNRPVCGIKLSIPTQRGIQQTISDSNGYYCFPDCNRKVFKPTMESSDYLPENGHIAPLPFGAEYIISNYNLYVIKGIKLEGKIENTQGTPISGANIREASKTRRFTNTFTSKEDGSFQFMVEPNRYYQFQLSAPDYIKTLLPGITVKEKAIRNLKFIMNDSLSISGIVYDSTGVPVNQASILLIPVNWGGLGNTPKERSRIDGSFTLQNLQPGHYNLYAKDLITGEFSSRKSIELDSRNLNNVKLQLQKGYSISGYISDSEGTLLEEAAVRIRSNSRIYNTISDQNGFFTKSKLPYGTYNLTVMHSNYLDKQIQNVQAGSTQTIVLEKAKLFELNLHVIAKSNQYPIDQFQLLLRDNQGFWQKKEIKNQDGNYTLERKWVLPITLTIRAEGYQTIKQTISTLESPVSIEMPPGIKVTGQIIDEESTDPIAYAIIRMYIENSEFREKVGHSDQYGYFSLENCIKGGQNLNITHSDYMTANHEVMIEQTDDYEYDLGKINISHGCRIIGTVIKKISTPIRNIPLELYCKDKLMSSVLTDRNGKFEFLNLPHGQYTIKTPTQKDFDQNILIRASDKILSVELHFDKIQNSLHPDGDAIK